LNQKAQNIEKRLTIHHIGGRSGSIGNMEIPSDFLKETIVVMYDADQDCTEHIAKMIENDYDKSIVLPYCIGGKNGKTSFHINNCPFTSSTIPTNAAFKDYYFFYSNHDHVWGEASKCLETRNIKMVSLDSLISDHKPEIPKPDILSLDTQGNEYEILQGAHNILNSNVLAVHCEVEFYPLYKNQKLFPDIFNLLSSQHFQFIEFTNLGTLSPFRGPIDNRGRSFTAYGDALFFKSFSQLKETIPNPSELYIAGHKLCLIATFYGQVEFAMHILNQLNRLPCDTNTTAEFRKQNYYIFLDKLHNEANKSNNLYPKSFSEIPTPSREKVPSVSRKKIKNLLAKYPSILNTIRYLLHSPKKINYFFSRLTKTKILFFSPFEKIFIEYGLMKIAKIIRKNRIDQGVFASQHPKSPLKPTKSNLL